nr:integrase core domain-containing protein [Yimella lutea]
MDRSHSRPRVSNDNPVSKSAFKTLTYAPVFPESSWSPADARAFSEAFFTYYNHEQRRSRIGLHTPAPVHHGNATEIRAQCQTTLNTAHPERLATTDLLPPRMPEAAWINRPSPEALIQTT